MFSSSNTMLLFLATGATSTNRQVTSFIMLIIGCLGRKERITDIYGSFTADAHTPIHIHYPHSNTCSGTDSIDSYIPLQKSSPTLEYERWARSWSWFRTVSPQMTWLWHSTVCHMKRTNAHRCHSAHNIS